MLCDIENDKIIQAKLPVCVSKIAVIDTIVATLWRHVHLHLDGPRIYVMRGGSPGRHGVATAAAAGGADPGCHPVYLPPDFDKSHTAFCVWAAF